MSNENQTPEEVVETNEGTEVEETTEETTEEPVETPTEPEVDYKKKFSESTREAQRLLEEKQAAEAELESLRNTNNESGVNYDNDSESLYPGFEMLSEDEQENLINYTNSIRNKVKDEVYKDPAIAFAKQSYNEHKWETAFNQVAQEIPQISESKDEFKAKYFKKDNVPDNISDILKDLSKAYLYDKAKDLGAIESAEKANRIDVERTSGGDKTQAKTTSRSLEEWHKLMEGDPAQFARQSEQYKKDLDTGKLK